MTTEGSTLFFLMKKLQRFAVGKFTRAEEKQIQDYIERLMRDLELDEMTLRS